MRSRTATKDAYVERLRTEYRIAFEHWARQVVRWQALRRAPVDVRSMEEAERRVAEAESFYRDIRNRLALEMIGGAVEVATSAGR